MTTEDNKYLTTGGLAALKNVDRRTVQKWVKAGIAPDHEVICGRIFFIRASAEAWQPPRRGRPVAKNAS